MLLQEEEEDEDEEEYGQNGFSPTAPLQRFSTVPLKAICHFPAESVHAHYSQYHMKWSFFRDL